MNTKILGLSSFSSTVNRSAFFPPHHTVGIKTFISYTCGTDQIQGMQCTLQNGQGFTKANSIIRREKGNPYNVSTQGTILGQGLLSPGNTQKKHRK